MARMTAAEAGRKGGQSRSEKKRAASRKNGFQKVVPPVGSKIWYLDPPKPMPVLIASKASENNAD
jgi:hypothetical protein